MEIKKFKGGYDKNITYILHNQEKAIILDPAIKAQKILNYLKNNNLKPKLVICLHGHPDHTKQLNKYKKENIPIAAHKTTKINTDKKLENQQKIQLGKNTLKIIHTPGHSKDSICLKTKNKLFTSDTLFVGTTGRTDLPDSQPQKMKESLQKIKELPDKTIIYPGHDYGKKETTTIKEQKQENPEF